MKVLVLFLDYQRHDHTNRVLEQNLLNAGHQFDLHVVDMYGLSAALNVGVKKALDGGYDALYTMANDILLPDNWLVKSVEYLQKMPNLATVGIHCVEQISEPTLHNGLLLHKWAVAFGNVLIRREVLERVGCYNIDYDPYGVQDLDYAYRCSELGYFHGYIHGLKSEHIGHDVGNGTAYREMKDNSLLKAHDKYIYWQLHYQEHGVHLTY